MSNVLIGVVGIMLFIGLALAGATFFGPVMQDSVQEGEASGTLRVLSEVAKSVSTRNFDMETSTPAALTAAVLVPDYLDQMPTNPVNGSSVMLLSADGLINGPAAYAVTKMPSTHEAMCRFINRSSGAGDSVPTASSLPNSRQRSGCLRIGVTYGPFVPGDFVAYLRIG